MKITQQIDNLKYTDNEMTQEKRLKNSTAGFESIAEMPAESTKMACDGHLIYDQMS